MIVTPLSLQRVIYLLPTLWPAPLSPSTALCSRVFNVFIRIRDPSMFLPLPLRSGARRIQKKREREFFLGRGRACTIRHSRFNLTSHLCRCETSEPAAVQAHQSGPLLGLCADSADVSRLSVVSLLSARGCKCHWRHAGGPIKSFLYVYEIQSRIFSSFSPPHNLSCFRCDECEYRIVRNLIGIAVEKWIRLLDLRVMDSQEFRQRYFRDNRITIVL